MKQIFITVPLLVLAALATAQSSGTITESAARTVADHLRTEVAQRSGNPSFNGALASRSRHIVFLVDTAQFEHKDEMVLFTKGFVERFLTDLGQEQQQALVPETGRHQVSFYPYQLRLSASPDNSVHGIRLHKAALAEIAAKVPTHKIETSGGSERGHDPVGARQELMRRLGKPTSDDPSGPFVVQIESVPFPEDPDHPEHEQQMKLVDARTGGLEETGLVPYGNGELFHTEVGGPGRKPYDVYVWLYGPESLPHVEAAAAAPRIQPSAPGGAKSGSATPSGGSGTTIGVIALIGTLAALVFLSRPKTIAIGSSSRQLRPGQTVGLVRHDNAHGPSGVVFASPGDAGAGHVGHVKRPFLGSATISPEAPHRLLVDGVDTNLAPVTAAKEYTFARPNVSFSPFRFDLSK